MFPPSHLAFGYLWYSMFSRVKWKRPPRGDSTLALFLGTQFPDLIDKPLAAFGVIRHGRFLGHSLVTIAVLAVLLWIATAGNLRRRRLVGPFVFGAISHSLADIVPKALNGKPLGADFGWLLWPVITGTPSYPRPEDVADYFSFPGVTLVEAGIELILDSFSGTAMVLWLVVGAIVWWYDGKPGLTEIVKIVR